MVRAQCLARSAVQANKSCPRWAVLGGWVRLACGRVAWSANKHCAAGLGRLGSSRICVSSWPSLLRSDGARGGPAAERVRPYPVCGATGSGKLRPEFTDVWRIIRRKLSEKFRWVGSLSKYIVGQKVSCCMRAVTSSVLDQFKEIPLLESLLNFQKDVFY